MKISDFAFEGCTGFDEITLPDSLEYLGSGAFGVSFMQTPTNEITLKFGPNVRRIRTCAFSGYKIKKIEVDKKNTCFKTDGKKLTSIDGSAVIAQNFAQLDVILHGSTAVRTRIILYQSFHPHILII